VRLQLVPNCVGVEPRDVARVIGFGELIASIPREQDGRGHQEIDYAAIIRRVRRKASHCPICAERNVVSCLPAWSEFSASLCDEKKVKKPHFGKGAGEGSGLKRNNCTQTLYPTLTAWRPQRKQACIGL